MRSRCHRIHIQTRATQKSRKILPLFSCSVFSVQDDSHTEHGRMECESDEKILAAKKLSLYFGAHTHARRQLDLHNISSYCQWFDGIRIKSIFQFHRQTLQSRCIYTLTFGLLPSIHLSIGTYTRTQMIHIEHGEQQRRTKKKAHALRHLFETNNIASTVNKQHQIAFYFVPFILFSDASTSTIHHSLCSCGGTAMVAVLSATMVMAVAAATAAMAVMKAKTHKSVCRFRTHIVPYIFSGVFACRFNSFWSSLVARRLSLVAVIVHVLVAFAVYVIVCVLFSFRFVSFRFVFFLFFCATASNSLVPSVRPFVCVCMVVDGYCVKYRVPFATP